MLRAMRVAEPPQPHIWQGIGRPGVTPVRNGPDTVAAPLFVLRTNDGVLQVHERIEVRACTQETGRCSSPSKLAI